MKKSINRAAFTMAEILLSLTIIGVVAAITLPSLTGNINERTWNTQRKALYSRMSQAIALMPSLNGYGSYSGTNTDGVVTATQDNVAETFITNGLAKVLKINNICDNDHLSDCGISSTFNTMAGPKNSFPQKMSDLTDAFTGTFPGILGGQSHDYVNPQNYVDTKAAAFETANGESVAVFYNPFCQANLGETTWYYGQTKMCANFIYDLNGKKGPNTVGKDVGFITVFYSADSKVVAPVPLNNISSTRVNHLEALSVCTKQDSETRLPNAEELLAMDFNSKMLGFELGTVGYDGFWSNSLINSNKAWYVNFKMGGMIPYGRSTTFGVWCIWR